MLMRLPYMSLPPMDQTSGADTEAEEKQMAAIGTREVTLLNPNLLQMLFVISGATLSVYGT